MHAQAVDFGGCLLVERAAEDQVQAVLVEAPRPAARVDHGLLQPSPFLGVLGLEIAEEQLVLLHPLLAVVHLLHLRHLRVLLELLLRRPGMLRPGALRSCLLPAALGIFAAQAAADGHHNLQNPLLQMPRYLSWLGGCLAPPCRGPRPAPVLCAPCAGCDAPVARGRLPRSIGEMRTVRRR